jgi:hypothetical protein
MRHRAALIFLVALVAGLLPGLAAAEKARVLVLTDIENGSAAIGFTAGSTARTSAWWTIPGSTSTFAARDRSAPSTRTRRS